MFDAIKGIQPNFVPDTVMVDFELALHRSIRDVFPAANLRGCLFHFAQCIQRKIIQEGLGSHCSDRGSDIWKSARRIMGLSFVPEHDIANAWEEVKARFPPMMIPIADYFEQTWLRDRAIFPIDT